MLKRHIVVPMAALLLGIAGGVMRANELANAFERASWFAIPNHPATITLMAFAGVFAVAVAIYIARADFRRPYGFGDAMAGVRSPYIIAQSLGLVLLMAGAARDLLVFMTETPPPMSRLIFAAFALLSGICLFAVSAGLFKGRVIAPAGFCMLTAIFWGCLWLLFTYWVKSADPVLLDYIYELFAVMFIVISLHLTAGGVFYRVHPKRTVFCLLMSVFMATLNGGGVLIARLFYGRQFASNEFQTMFYFGFAVVYCLSFCIVLMRNCRQKDIQVVG